MLCTCSYIRVELLGKLGIELNQYAALVPWFVNHWPWKLVAMPGLSPVQGSSGKLLLEPMRYSIMIIKSHGQTHLRSWGRRVFQFWYPLWCHAVLHANFYRFSQHNESVNQINLCHLHKSKPGLCSYSHNIIYITNWVRFEGGAICSQNNQTLEMREFLEWFVPAICSGCCYCNYTPGRELFHVMQINK